MPKKRRNNGRSKKGRGHTRLVDCAHCGCKPNKDKAIKRYIVRNMVDAGALNDLKAACAYEGKLSSSAPPLPRPPLTFASFPSLSVRLP